MRDKFTFKRLYFSIISLEKPSIKLEVLNAICEYALNGKIPSSLSQRAEHILTTILPHLERSNRLYKNGKNGGAPKGCKNNPNGRKGKQQEEVKEEDSKPLQQEVKEKVQKKEQNKEAIQVIITPKKTLTKEDLKEKIKEKKSQFAKTLNEYLDAYGKDLLNQFYKYWTEPNRSGTKLRWELEKTWDISRRLERWSRAYSPTTQIKKDNFSIAEEALNNNPFNK